MAPKFVLHDQGDDAILDQYSIQNDKGAAVLLFNTTKDGLSAREVLAALNSHHDLLAALKTALSMLGDRSIHSEKDRERYDQIITAIARAEGKS